MAHRNLIVIDATERATDRITQLTARPQRLMHVDQMTKSVQSIGANISEGFGRGPGRDRSYFLRMARGSAEETIRHLATNYRNNRIAPKVYWSLHNLLVVIVKMLNGLMYE